MEKFPILIVDDEDIMRNALIDTLEDKGFNVSGCDSGENALKILGETHFDVVLSDVKMPGMSGHELLSEIKKISENIDVVLMTAYGTIETAVEAMKNGASDYITKPFSFDEIEIVLKKIRNNRKITLENKLMKKELTVRHSFNNIIGKSQPMQKIYDLIEKISSSPSTVLITGDSGTGKELIAGAIHYNGKRKDKPLVKLNCAAMPETLLESELFGHEKGAFTGAYAKKMGQFEIADGGTLFLDEIGEIPISVQAKLLRVIQEKSFNRVGGVKPEKVDVRIIAATNVDLEAAVKEGKFRADLFFRLNVIPIVIPPLRVRKDDIPLLAEHYLKKFSSENEKEFKDFSSKALKKLIDYNWPGNVRELMNIIERTVVLNNGVRIEEEMLPDEINFSGRIDKGEFPHVESSIQELEAFHIGRILKHVEGNLSKAARILGIDRKTLYTKIEKYGLENK